MNEIERRMFEPDDTDEHSVDGIEPLVETMKQVIELDQTRDTPARSIDIELGDQFLAEGNLEKGRMSYFRALTSSKARLDESGADSQAQVDFDLAVSSIGRLAFESLIRRNTAWAIKTIKAAVSYKPDLIWLCKIQAHALMLSARITEARNLHREYCHQTLENGERWGDTIGADFDALRVAGFNLPIMDRLERDFASK